jgi:hypothetical protein
MDYTGSVKVAGVACLHRHDSITREESPHPPPCGPASPQDRGIEIKITALSWGRGGPTDEVGEGTFSSRFAFDGTLDR